MTLAEMIALYRAQSMDIAEPPFCEDELLIIYANEGQDEACRRGQLLRDAASALCLVGYSAGDESVAIDPRIVQVARAQADGHPVGVVGADEMDASVPGWDAGSSAANRPSTLVAGLSSGRLHLWPVPTQAGRIKLQVFRLPLKKLADNTDKPEIRPELHPALVDWMLYRAYSREDSDLHNDSKAAIALARFEAEFGRKTSGRNEVWMRNGQSPMPGPIA
ncbi:hypothetical protein LJR074_003191 [Acidovorax sp. LjRoot74]|uniref:phage adaptor protein n=1 Tax=Acidovorax sp. LjRoot74 TaxID=3342337 RepID=UPI003ED0E3A7